MAYERMPPLDLMNTVYTHLGGMVNYFAVLSSLIMSPECRGKEWKEWNNWKEVELSSRKKRPDKRGRVSQDHPLGSGYFSSTYIALSTSALKASKLVKPTFNGFTVGTSPKIIRPVDPSIVIFGSSFIISL